MRNLIRLWLLVFTAIYGVSCSRVLELSDKFIDISNEGMWFVKFYAPWCAHCRRIEPIWAHVAQSLYNSHIKVAKVDCTRFPAVATHFKVRAYPTILFIKGSQHHEYNGERMKDDMVNYAVRMSQPAVQRVTQADSLGYLKETHSVFFGFVGKQQGPLWEMFLMHADKYQAHSWFYAMSNEIVKDDIPNDAAVFCYKEDEAYFFDADPAVIEDTEALNTTLDKWINAERFGFFPKITRSNIHHLMDTEKFIVIAVVSENKLSEITQTERDFKDMIEGVIKNKKKSLHSRFQFGWMGSLELANSIAMTELTTPHLLVLNSTTSHHHMPDDDPVLMTPEAVAIFLDQIHNQMAPFLRTNEIGYTVESGLQFLYTEFTFHENNIVTARGHTIPQFGNLLKTYGGNSWPVRVYRGFFEARSTLTSMWRGNPVLTALVFGLPLGFLSLICYSVCCADILDAEEEELPETHEKKD